MYRITYIYWKPVKQHPEWGKHGESVISHIDGKTLESVCRYFDEIRYHHDNVKYTTIDFIKIEEVEK